MSVTWEVMGQSMRQWNAAVAVPSAFSIIRHGGALARMKELNDCEDFLLATFLQPLYSYF